MKITFLALPVIAMLILGTLPLPYAAAQFQAGGVTLPGDPSWFAGEGIKKGDLFRYSMCHVDYKECAEFEMDVWIKGDTTSGTEEKWLTEVVVYDGNKVVKGEMDLGKLAPEPSGGSDSLGVYRGAFKSSIAWLSAFANGYDEGGDKGPKKFSAKSWGKIGNIGGEQIIPTSIEKVTVPAGTYETVLISWKTGGATSKVWVVDNFPFPIKAKTYTHVSEGIPPTEYEFTLLEYKENIQQNPFTNITSTSDIQSSMGCQQNYDLVSVKKPTKNFDYQVHVFYGPEDPIEGCEMQWLIKFISKYDDTEFLNQVKFDLLVVDNNLKPLRSIAQDEGRDFLYSPSGQAEIDMIVEEPPGIAHYVIWVYGLAPEHIVPSTPADYLQLDIPIRASNGESAQKIPAWIKNNAGWWADGSIDDNSFVQGIQFLIKEGIMKIPQSAPSSSSSSEPESWFG
jgi:hypothetical protein